MLCFLGGYHRVVYTALYAGYIIFYPNTEFSILELGNIIVYEPCPRIVDRVQTIDALNQYYADTEYNRLWIFWPISRVLFRDTFVMATKQ